MGARILGGIQTITIVWLLQSSLIVLSGQEDSTLSPSSDSNNSPCPRDGYVGLIGDSKEPRKYYRCKGARGNPKRYPYDTLYCDEDQVFNSEKLKCQPKNTIPPGNGTTDYECLKQRLDNDGTRICFDETVDMLSKSMVGFIDAVSHRGEPGNNFRLSIRDVHLNMRENYLKMIQSVGQNIFPLIVATDSDTPDLAGTGGTYKVYFRNGTMRRIVPVGPAFEIHKCLSHMILGVFSIISPYFKSPDSINWKGKLGELNQRLKEALYSLSGSALASAEKDQALKMITIINEYITNALSSNSVTYQSFQKLGKEMSPYIDKSMEIAAKAHVSGTVPALQKLKAEMGDEEWRNTYVLIPTVWPVSMYNIRLQAFRKVMDFKQIKSQVLITEGARSEDEARTTLGRIVADRALAVLVFGGSTDDKTKDHLFSLATRRDLLSSAEEEAMNRWCNGDDSYLSITATQSPNGPRCPMSKHFATMLRQAP